MSSCTCDHSQQSLAGDDYDFHEVNLGTPTNSENPFIHSHERTLSPLAKSLVLNVASFDDNESDPCNYNSPHINDISPSKTGSVLFELKKISSTISNWWNTKKSSDEMLNAPKRRNDSTLGLFSCKRTNTAENDLLMGPDLWIVDAQTPNATSIIDPCVDLNSPENTCGCLSVSTCSTVSFAIKRILSAIKTIAQLSADLDSEANVNVYDVETCYFCINPQPTILPPSEAVGALCDALHTLQSLMDLSEERLRIVINHNGCETVIKALKQYTSSFQVCVAILPLLSCFCHHKIGILRLNHLDGMKYVVEILNIHMPQKDIVSQCCNLLCCLMTGNVQRRKLVSFGFLDIFHNLLGHFGTPYNDDNMDTLVDLMSDIAKVLFSIIFDCSDNIKAVKEKHTCELLMSAYLGLFSGMHDVLNNLDMISGSSQRYLVVQFEQDHREEKHNDCHECSNGNIDSTRLMPTALWGLRVFGTFAWCCEDNKDMLGSMGCCGLVVHIVRICGTIDDRLTEAVCFAVANLANRHSENQWRLVKAGVLELLASLFGKHCKSLEVVRECSNAIYTLVLGSEYTKIECDFLKLFSQLTAEVIIYHANSGNHSMKAFLMESLWHGMSGIILEIERQGNISLDHNICDSILCMMSMVKILTRKSALSLCNTLYIMTKAKDNCSYIGNEGIGRGIYLLSNTFGHEVDICVKLYQSIEHLTQIESNRMWLGAAGVCKSAVMMLKINICDMQAVKAGVCVVAKLSSSSRNNCQKLSSAGLYDLLPKLIYKYAAVSCIILESCAICASNLSNFEEHSDALLLNGGFDALICAWHSFLFNKILVEAVCISIVNLTKSKNITTIAFKKSELLATILLTLEIHLVDDMLIGIVIEAINALLTSIVDFKRVLGNNADFGKQLALLLQNSIKNKSFLLTQISFLTSSLCEGNQAICATLAEAGVCSMLIYALKNFSNDLDVVKGCFRGLQLMIYVPQIRSLVGSLGACEVISTILKFYSKEKYVIVHGLDALAMLCKEDPCNIEFFQNCDIYNVMITVMTCDYNVIDLDLTKIWCRAISLLVDCEEIRMILGEKGVCEIVMTCLEIHMLDASVVMETSLAIGSLVGNRYRKNIVKFVAFGSCRLLGIAMALHKENAAVAWSCCSLLINFCQEYDSFERCSTGEVVLSVMRIHDKDKLVLQWGCLAIESMSLDNKNRDALVKSGACDVIISSALLDSRNEEALEATRSGKLAGNVNVAKAACRAMFRICVDNDTYCEKMGIMGACEAVLTVMEKYVADDGLAQIACEVLIELACGCSSNKTKVGHTSGCARIISSLLLWHCEIKNVVLVGFRALEVLSNRHHANAIKFGTSDICTAIVKGMQCNLTCADVASTGCCAIVSLACNERNVSLLGASGACNIALEVMRYHGQELAVAWNGFQAIANLSVDSANCELIGAAGGCKTVAAALLSHLSNSDMSHLAWRCIGSLCNFSGNIIAFTKIGICDVSIRSLQNGKNEKQPVLELCRVIARLAKNSDSRNALWARNVCDLLTDVMESHSESVDVVVRSFKTVIALCNNGHKEVQDTFRKCNGCDALLRNLRMHQQCHEDAAKWGSIAIRDLVKHNRDNQTIMENLGAGKVMLNVLHRPENHEYVIGCALAAMRFLIEGHGENTLIYSTKDMCDVVITIFERHLHCVSVALNCCYLVVLLLPFSSEWFLRSSNSIEDICIASLQAHYEESEELVVICCDAMTKLCSIPEGAIRFCYGGVTKLITYIIKTQLSNITICLSCLQLLLRLSKPLSNMSYFETSEICNVVIMATQKYYLRKKVVKIGCAVISSLACKSDKIRLYLISEGGIDLLTILFDVYTSLSSQDPPPWINSALSALTK